MNPSEVTSEMTADNYTPRNVVEPKGIVQVMRDSWWWCIDGDPTKAIFYTPRRKGVGSPQCNSNRAIAERVGQSLGHDMRAQLIQIPLAFAPWED